MGILHVGMNVLALAELGRVAETEIKGPRLVLAYVITGIAGFVVSAYWYRSEPYVTAGASGAVFGIDGLLIGDMLAKSDRRWREALVRTVVHSFIFYAMLGTNQAAHLGGLFVGLALGYLFGKESRPWRISAAANVGVMVSVVAIVTSIVLSMRSPQWRAYEERERLQEDRMRQGATQPDVDSDD
jgi:membrane associated rhomboid family serine protease